MRNRTLTALCTGLLMSVTAPAAAQEGGFALNHLQPSPAGDMFFGVPSPYAAGHLEPPKAYAMFDYAHRPIRIGDTAVVEAQGFMRLDVSWALWNRLLISADAPLSIVQSGGADLGGTTFTTLESPSFGDVRIGLRGRLWGENHTPFQLGVGGYLFVPSGDQPQYTGAGAVRGRFEVPIGGRIGKDVAFIYSAAVGLEVRAGDNPHAFTYGAAGGVLFADDMVQVGAEFIGSTAFGGGTTYPISSVPLQTASAGTNAEILGGVKVRFLEGLTLGASAGPGVGSAVGTPIFRAMGMLGWTPLPAGAPADSDKDRVAMVKDSDDDGIADDKDACPDVAGEPNLDPAKDGCPPSDRDGDGVLDVDDACPTTSGFANTDLTQNGCPTDTDGDGFHDGIDACREVIGDDSEDESKRGCPADDDEDGIANKEDACPQSAGDPHDDPTKTGCPPDPDEDGIRYAADACPNEKGPPSDDPSLNGCPRFARYKPKEGEIIILQRIEFQTYGTAVSESVTSNSTKVLKEVAQIILDHPELTLVEVQGHTDDSGDEEYNLDLSQKRAESVRKWLIDKGGVEANRLSAKGYGMSKPIADNRTRIGRQKNRRVQFVVKKSDPDKKKNKPKKAKKAAKKAKP